MVLSLQDNHLPCKVDVAPSLKNIPSRVQAHQVSSALKTDPLFAKITEEVGKKPDLAKSINAVFAYNITENGKVVKKWTLDLKTPEVYEGAPKTKADTTITVSDNDLTDVVSGKISAQVAFMKGKLKISGNMMLAQKLQPLLKTDSKL